MNPPEAELKSIMSKLEWNYVRKEWSRRTRSKGITGTYSDIFAALKDLIQVIRLVMQCYEKHTKVYKRLGPKAKNGGLNQFLAEVMEFKTFLEDSFFYHLRQLLPHKMPNEILTIILEFAQTGQKRFDFGFYSKIHLDQVCETIQRKKFLVLTKTLTINLINCIMMSKMDSRGLTIETLMEYFVKDASAFKDLTDEDFENADFSKFSKIPYIPYKKPATQISTYLNSASGKKLHSPVKIREHDYALSQYMM
eukprot:GFUD01026649.1.p1 GENE.GFUD01026649.1~~GFUD01026649.1.p1  ORF type:complete len:251 (+),score=24.10 GFUD01026649.1:177-929(+)